MNRIYLIICLLFGISLLNAQSDTTPPNIFCPPNDTVTLGSGDCTFQYFYSVISNDDMPGDTLILLSGLPSGENFPLGNTVNVFQATDAAGNTATCSFMLTVQNFAGPLVCQSAVSVAMDTSCYWKATPSSLLTGNYGCADSIDYYAIEVDKTPPQGNGPWTIAEFGAGDIGKTYTFRVRDTLFGYECQGSVQIKDLIAPIMSCTDFTISCAVDNVAPVFLKDSLGIDAAMPTLQDDCSSIKSLQHLDSTVPDSCNSGFVGHINRTWTAQDGFGNASTCLQVISLDRPAIGDLQYPVDIAVDCADTDYSPAKTGAPYLEFAGRKWTSTCSLGTAYNDSTVVLCPGISQVYRVWFVIDWCNGDALEKTQVITLNDATGPAFLDCPANITLSVPTNNCVASVDLPDMVISDACSYATDVSAYWEIDSLSGILPGSLSDFAGNDTTLSDTLAVLGSIPGVPPGIHLIRYTATDACGATSTCQFNLHVWDSVPPALNCPPVINVALEPTGFASLIASTPVNNASDDCGDLTFKIKRLDADNCTAPPAFDDLAEFCCLDLSDTVRIVIRVYDVPVPAGAVPDSLAQSQSVDCQISVVLSDPAVVCDLPDSVVVSGIIATPNATRVVNANVKLEINPSPVYNTLTDSNGEFIFAASVAPGTAFTVTPFKNTFHLDGVSTFDLVLISKHILNLETLDSPYKMIAADANRSGSITTFDVVEIRKLILGIYTELPSNTSWRFVDEEFTFADPFNPFLFPFPESIYHDGQAFPTEPFDFAGVKIGDVNNTAQGDPFAGDADDRGENPDNTLFFNTEDRNVAPGDLFEVKFEADRPATGWQFTLETDGLEVADISGDGRISAANFGVFSGALTTSVDLPAGPATGAFSVRFRAARSGRLSDMIRISDRITRAEAYLSAAAGVDVAKSNVALRMQHLPGKTGSNTFFEVYQNQPNPFDTQTRIGFSLPDDADVTLRIFDEAGRLLYTRTAPGVRGYQEWLVDADAALPSGVLHYHIETSTHCAVRKMLRL